MHEMTFYAGQSVWSVWMAGAADALPLILSQWTCSRAFGLLLSFCTLFTSLNYVAHSMICFSTLFRTMHAPHVLTRVQWLVPASAMVELHAPLCFPLGSECSNQYVSGLAAGKGRPVQADQRLPVSFNGRKWGESSKWIKCHSMRCVRGSTLNTNYNLIEGANR